MRCLVYIGNALIATLFFLCVASCSEEYSSPLKGQTVSNQVFGDGANSETITIGNSDLSKCTVAISADWCNVSIQGSSVTISVQANDTYDERQATITLTDPEDATTLSFIVVQKQNDAIFVDESTFNVPEEGGIVTVKIESNVDYEVELPANGWITILNGTRGLKKSELSLKVALNNSGNVRKGIVKIVNKETGTYESIIIKQALTPRVEIDPNSISVDEQGGEFLVKVKSNVMIANITTNEKWIDIGEKKDIDGFNFSVVIKILPMYNQSERSGLVAFESSNGSFLYLLSVSQKINEILSVDKTSISVDYNGGEQYFTLTANNDFSISTPSWIKIVEISKGQLNNEKTYYYKVIISRNDSYEEREGSIIIKGKAMEIAILVNQKGSPNIGSKYSQLIIGKWQYIYHPDQHTTYYLEFKSDMTFADVRNNYGINYYDIGVYKVDGDILYLHYNKFPEVEWSTFHIFYLTETELQLFQKTVLDKKTYIRVKSY